MAVVAFLALGANLGDPGKQVAAAIARLDGPQIQVLRRARLYRSSPLGPPGQPEYLNTAVEIRTELDPLGLLEAAKAVETDLGRTGGVRWGPRLIDIDIALYADVVFEHTRLIIPHRELSRRRFVLAPLADLAPGHPVPGTGQTVSELLARLDDNPVDLRVIDETLPERDALLRRGPG